MSRQRVGLMMMIIGISVMAAGIVLGIYNLWDNYRAGLRAGIVLDAIQDQEPPSDPDQELPSLEVDGYRYIGTLSIPAIGIELPVQENWNLALLKISPCRYMGSPYQGDFIICAHNYATHFGRLKNLQLEDEVLFTDLEGNGYRYAVASLETLEGTAVEEMEAGEWDLTLFTCTLGGQARMTVRCDLLESIEPY